MQYLNVICTIILAILVDIVVYGASQKMYTIAVTVGSLQLLYESHQRLKKN